MQPQLKRLLRALAREGLDVSYDGTAYSVRLRDAPHAPAAEVLLPPNLKLEAKAARQLASLASVRHPAGGRVRRCCATPDVHPGDSGIAIGSVVQTEDLLIPQAVGSDINCGMRLHTTELTVDQYLGRKADLVGRAKGDYLLGTRDVAMSAAAMQAMFAGGIGPWVASMRREAHGSLCHADLDQIEREAVQRVAEAGGRAGDPALAPQTLVPDGGVVRDDGLGTIGRGNHFVELQAVREIRHGGWAHAWGIRPGQLAFMIHSGSRKVGKAIGTEQWRRAREAWPDGQPYPRDRIFAVHRSHPLYDGYLRAEATAANYGFVNRAVLAELLRLRLREVFGDLEAPLLADLPHNLSTFEMGDDGVRRWVCRKGACAAHADQPVVIPGSMGTSSYVLVGRGAPRCLSSASHGAGRSRSRGAMGRTLRDASHRQALGLDGVDCVTLREERLIQEAPAAYKPIHDVVDAQVRAGVVDVVAVLEPLVTFKA
ncbi:MAG: RtcB family protein [Myxococcales bacterium]|nr:RtcB family protein [Myxococcales bacterium]